ncbi:MAG: hypothetical protein WCF93_03995 [Candidatus Moraniibacteriota bacterium]
MFKKIPTRIKFLSFVCILYMISFFIFPDATVVSLKNFLSEFFKVLPILGMVFFVMFLGYIFLKPQVIKKYLGQGSGIKGWIFALFASIFMAAPTYLLFPLLKELKSHGMKNSLIAVFLNNRNVQPAFLPVMIFYFGLPFTIVFSMLILCYALLSGFLMGQIVKD